MNDQAPGCYGSALTYEEGAAECRTCPFAEGCAPLSKASLERIQLKLGIIKPAPQPAQAVPSQPLLKQSVLTARLPKKVVEFLERFERQGIRITEALNRRENPFMKSSAPFRIACHLLIKMPNGIDSGLLATALQLKLAWTKESSDAYARLVFQTLEAAGATVVKDGKTMIRRSEG